MNKPGKDQVVQAFTQAFGHEPAVVARAPGRVEVLGNHTDYNEGYTLSCAIDKEVWVAVSRSADGKCHLFSTHFSKTITVANIVRQTENTWVNYPLGVYAMLKNRGLTLGAFTIAIHSTIPSGAGVSSSAALEVATALALCKLFGENIDKKELARVCQDAENQFVGMNCGLLDQFSSMFGKENQVLFIDYRSLEHRTVAMGNSDITLAVTLSGVTHSLITSAYNDRRRECFDAAAYFTRLDPSVKALRDVSLQQLLAAEGEMDALSFKRALHVVGEDERVMEGMELLENGNIADFGKLLYASHESSKNNFENSCPELDILVAIAKKIDGVYGARLTGGGFGGAMLTFMHTASRETFEKTVKEQYKAATGRDAIVHFALIANGASLAS